MTVTGGPWILSLAGLGCLAVLAWLISQLRHPYRFDADLVAKYQRGELGWKNILRAQRMRQRARRRQ